MFNWKTCGVTEQQVWHLGIEFGISPLSPQYERLSRITLVGTVSGLLALDASGSPDAMLLGLS